jgi:hypothetical protein
MFAASKTAAAGTPPPASTDPQFNYVSLLLNDTGTNGAQNNTFLDSSSNNFTIARNGTPTQGSVTPYWPDGQWSNYFSGSGQYLSVPDSVGFAYGSGDFTIESNIYLTAYASADNDGFYRSSIISQDQFAPVTSRGWLSYLQGTASSFTTINFTGWSGGSATSVSGSFSFALNTWYHVAIVRNSNRLYFYVNGVLLNAGGTAFAVSINDSSIAPKIGAAVIHNSLNFNWYFPGYISNLRIVKGTALYTSNFTPSTTPLTAVSGTSLLTCQSNRFKDNSSNNFAITVTGTPTVQAFDPFSPASNYGVSNGGSGYFPGSGNYISLAGTVNQNLLGNSDFTIELWAYSATSTFNQTLLSHTDISSGRGYGWNLRFEGNYNIKFYVGSGTAGTDNEFLIATSTGIRQNTWNHIAITRQGSSTRCFVNGALITTVTFPATFDLTGRVPFQVGQRGTSLQEPIVGYISNARVVAGTAVYTSAFTPPTSPVTAITNTSLLLNFTNAGIYDAATLNDLVTVGDTKVSTAVAKFGSSSMYFDGTGDWLTFVDSPATRFEAGDFTVEGWVYLSTTGTAKYVAAKGTSTTGWALGVNSSNQIVFNYTSSTLTGSTALSSGQWYHIAVVRNGTATGNVKIYLSGTADATSGGAINDNFNQTSIGYVGADRTGTNAMNGYLDDLRITKGYARYTANFTPPTAPFPTR